MISLDNLEVRDIYRTFYTKNDLRLAIAENMLAHGGSFVKALSACIITADEENLYKLIIAFKSYILEYQPKNWRK